MSNGKAKAIGVLSVIVQCLEAMNDTMEVFESNDDIMWSEIESQLRDASVEMGKRVQACAAIVASRDPNKS